MIVLGNISEYVILGITHIWTGYDHLLFLLAVLIGTNVKWDYLKIVTSFTLGHSITLALAALEIITIPSIIIEPLIALSIIYVAIENMVRKTLKGRWILTMLFGLIHGFGFASIINGSLTNNFLLKLFSFNLGVEIGQLIIVMIVIPLLIYLSKKVKKKTQINYAFSFMVGIMGIYWLIERVF